MAELDARCLLIPPPAGEARSDFDRFLGVLEQSEIADHFQLEVTELEDRDRGRISAETINALCDAAVVLVDESGIGRNAMYMLGLLHGLNRPVLHIAAQHAKLSFTSAQRNLISYHPEDREEMEAAGALLLREVQRLSSGGTWYPHHEARGEKYGEAAAGAAVEPEEAQSAGPAEDPKERRRQLDAAGDLIDLLAGRGGFRRVTFNARNKRRLTVHGDRSLDLSGLPKEIGGFGVDWRLA